jgi:hypothetical protein
MTAGSLAIAATVIAVIAVIGKIEIFILKIRSTY